jgi:NADH-dependent peroxiredoxin subunit F
MKDLIIIGGGPAGVSAGVYAARKLLTTDVVAEEFGGQSTVSEGIENWIGTVNIPGLELGKALKGHLEAYAGGVVTLHEGVRASGLKKVEGGYELAMGKGGVDTGTSLQARAVLIASGASRRKLTIPGAAEYEHKGLTYCASCDGPLYSGMDVAVIGGGNAGFETALQLLAYCKTVTLIHRGTDFKADPITVAKAKEHANMRILTSTEPTAVVGEKFVNGLTVRNIENNESTTLSVSGIFVEIGVVPSTDYAKDVVDLDTFGRVIADPRTQRTSVEGIWAAGDCTDELYHQNNIAAGDAVKALEDIYIWLKTR